MASKHNLPSEYSGEGAMAAGDDAVTAGPPSPKKPKTKATATSDSRYQTMAFLLANKLVKGGWDEHDVSKITELIATEIKADLKEQATLTEGYGSMDDNAWATLHLKRGYRLYCRALTRRAQLYSTERWFKYSIERWINLSNMGDEEAKAQLDMELKRAPGSATSSHVNTSHEEIDTIEEADFTLDKIPLLSDVMVDPSLVLTQIIRSSGWNFMTEADVFSSVSMAIEDALAYTNNLLNHYTPSKDSHSIKLVRITEYGMFSNKPDHFIITANYPKFNMLFPVVFETEHEKVFTSETIGGRVFDYIMLRKMLTGQPSLAVLTTFNRSKIVWDPDCYDLVKTGGRFTPEKVKATVDSVINTMKKSNPPPPPSANDDGGDFKTPEATTKHLREPLTDSPSELVEDEKKQEADSKRLLMYSEKEYIPCKLISVLCNVLIASLNKGLSKITIQTGNLQKGQTILVLKGKDEREQLYEWRTQPVEVKVTGSWMDFDSTQNEYLVRSRVGFGSTSRCWGAVVIPDNEKPQNGFSCVIKYWIKIWDEETNYYLTRNEIEEESEKTTREEVENYKKIYDDIFFPTNKGGCVAQKKLNNAYCVILPFFEPIKKDERKGDKLELVLKEVRNVLSKNFYKEDERKSYQFRKTDQRWRHIGRWTEPGSPGRKHLVLFDLADLEMNDATKDQHDEYIESHIKTLRESLEELEFL